MDINEFAQRVREEVEKAFGSPCRAQLKEVRKNNGVLFHGLMAAPPERNVVPTIYLESFHAAYEDGVPFGEVLERILEIFRGEVPKGDIDMSFFKNYGKVRDRVCYRLIGRERNQELLEKIPYVDFLDLAICFYYAYSSSELGDGTILIHNSHMEQWGVAVRDLMKLAERNTSALFPGRLSLLQEMLPGAGGGGDIRGNAGESAGDAARLLVLTNDRRVHGAACVLYPGLLERIGAEKKAGFYIVPSSVHEVLILDQASDISPEEMREMIREVNRKHVAAEEILSDQLYYYDPFSGTVRIVS